MRPRSAFFGFAGAIALAVLPRPILANAPPPSAAGLAMQTEEELTESESLLFVFPQRAAMGPGRLFTLDTGNNSSGFGTSGLVLGSGALQAFAAVSDVEWGQAARVQAGGAWSGDAWRAGVGFRWAQGRETREDTDWYLPTDEVRTRRSWTERRTIGLAAGLGGTWSSVAFDVVVHADREELDASAEESQDDATPTRDQHDMDFDREHGWGGALRLRAHWGERTTSTLSAAFQDRSGDLRVRQTYFLEAPFEHTDELYGHAARSAVAMERRVTDSTWVSLYASYADTRGDNELAARFGIEVTQSRDEIRAAGASVRRPAWWGTMLYAGFRTEMHRTVNEETFISGDYVNTRAFSAEATQQRFGWGASRTIGDFDLMAHMSSTLSLSNPVASLDATIRF